MKEGTVSSGVALRPRPTEVQPHFLGSNLIFGIFYNMQVSHLHIDFCYHIISMCHFRILTSVTIFLLWVTFAY